MITLMNKRAKNKKGFTLIELLVVLAILAIIALIAVPNFIGVREDAANKADQATVELIEKALELMIVSEKITPKAETICTVNGSGVASLAGELNGKESIFLKYFDTNDIKIQGTTYANGMTFTSDVNGKVTGTHTAVSE